MLMEYYLIFNLMTTEVPHLFLKFKVLKVIGFPFLLRIKACYNENTIAYSPLY